MTAAIAVVIVAHNSGATLADCVRRARESDQVAEIIIVDNASDDGGPHAAVVEAGVAEGDGSPPVRLIENPDNRGFGAACNQGAGASSAEWIAFLNPDCFVERDSFAQMLASAATQPDFALLGAAVCDSQGVPERAARRRDPTLARIAASLFGRVQDGSPQSLYSAPDDGAPLQPVDATSGALMLIRRAWFERVAGFDEAYRLHAEDLDLCRRLRLAGGAVGVVSAVPVTHLKGTSSTRRPLFVAWHKHRGLARYFRKFGAGGSKPTTVVAIIGVWLMFVMRLPRVALSAKHRSS